MLRKKTNASAELAAEAVEAMAAPAQDPTLRSYQAVAAAIAPAVFPTERWRQDTKEMMLREMKRPRGVSRADAGSRDEEQGGTLTHVVEVSTGSGQARLADMETISEEQATEGAATLARIVARHDHRIRRP